MATDFICCAVPWLCSGAALALARRYLHADFAVLAVALSLLQINSLFISDLLFTEIPFALFSVLFVLVALDDRLASRRWLREPLSFVLVTAGFLLRTAGLALFCAGYRISSAAPMGINTNAPNTLCHSGSALAGTCHTSAWKL